MLRFVLFMICISLSCVTFTFTLVFKVLWLRVIWFDRRRSCVFCVGYVRFGLGGLFSIWSLMFGLQFWCRLLGVCVVCYCEF